MIQQLLKEENIAYKLIDEDKDYKLVKVNSKVHILYLFRTENKFILDRDLFDYIDGNSIPYSILCHDTMNKKLYYLKLNKDVNWVKSCFETCEKDSLFLGKNVMKSQIMELSLRKELQKYK